MSTRVYNALAETAEEWARWLAFEDRTLDELYQHREADMVALADTDIRIGDTGYYRVNATEAEPLRDSAGGMGSSVRPARSRMRETHPACRRVDGITFQKCSTITHVPAVDRRFS